MTLHKTLAALAILSLVVFSLSSCSAARPAHSGISSVAPRPHRVSSCCAPARKEHHGINPTALAVIRPVFVLWKKCNAAIDMAAADYHGKHYDSLDQDGNNIHNRCDGAYLFVPRIELKGSLAHNPYMNDAITSLLTLFWFKEGYASLFTGWTPSYDPECERHMGEASICIISPGNTPNQKMEEAIKMMKAVDPNATRFWYDLDHTA
jgi:hypothetical protein